MINERNYYIQAFRYCLNILFIESIYIKKQNFLCLIHYCSPQSSIIYVKLFDLNWMCLTDLSGISLFLGPLIVSLAIPIVKQMDLIKKYSLPILAGSIVGALVSMFSVILLGKLFNLPDDIIASVIPKSSTTPIAIEVANRLGGILQLLLRLLFLQLSSAP